MIIFGEILTIGQAGSGAEMDIGNLQGGRGPGDVESAKIVDLKGQQALGVNIGNGGVDNKIRTMSFQVITDIAAASNGELFAARGPEGYGVGRCIFEIVVNGAADKAGTANENAMQLPVRGICENIQSLYFEEWIIHSGKKH
jgi:hypothetical protein